MNVPASPVIKLAQHNTAGLVLAYSSLQFRETLEYYQRIVSMRVPSDVYTSVIP